MKLKGRDLLTWTDYSRDEFLFLLNLSKNMKERLYAGGEKYAPQPSGQDGAGHIREAEHQDKDKP